MGGGGGMTRQCYEKKSLRGLRHTHVGLHLDPKLESIRKPCNLLASKTH